MKEQRTFFKAYNDVMSTPCKGKITQNLKMVYCLLLAFTENAEAAFPSNQYIADSLGISKRAVIDNTAELERMGLIEKQRRFNNSNIFIVNKWEIPLEVQPLHPPSEVSSPPSAMSSPPEVQPTALYKTTDKTIYYITEKISEAVKEITDDDAPINITSFPCTSSKVKCGWSLDDLEEDDPF